METVNVDLNKDVNNVGISEETKTENKASEAQKKELISLAQYNRALLKHLPKGFLKRDPLRLMWSVFFLGASAAIVYSFLNYDLPIVLKLVLALFMGTLLGGNAFLAHEVLHGSVVKNKTLQNIYGFIGFAPFLISPTYWKFWHNHLHHGNTQLLYKDPDAFPTKMIYKRSKFMRWAFKFTPGSGTLVSYLYFFWWFSFQAVLNQAYMRFGNKMWAGMNHKRVTIEFTCQIALALAYVNLVGPSNWIYLVIIPFMVQNYTVMSYISTNHNISPYTRVNDPLVNSLSVSNNPVLEFLHLNFGYHTEHHLFPNMPMSKAKTVSKKLQELYPDRYMIMPKRKALKLLYSTPRIYKNRETLVHPISGKEYETLNKENLS